MEKEKQMFIQLLNFTFSIIVIATFILQYKQNKNDKKILKQEILEHLSCLKIFLEDMNKRYGNIKLKFNDFFSKDILIRHVSVAENIYRLRSKIFIYNKYLKNKNSEKIEEILNVLFNKEDKNSEEYLKIICELESIL